METNMNTMTVYEYIKALLPGKNIFKETDGARYIDEGLIVSLFQNEFCIFSDSRLVCALIHGLLCDVYDEPKYRFIDNLLWISEDDWQRFQQYRISIDEEVREFDSYVKRPYYQMRGKKISKEQAMEVIARNSDYLTGPFSPLSKQSEARKKLVPSINFNQWWFEKNHYPMHYGWCHPSGVVGSNAITTKYPNITEFAEEMFSWAVSFPFLDLMIAVSDWNEDPYWSEAPGYQGREQQDAYEVYADFTDNIQIGIWLHDKTVEFMNPKNAAKKYLEYAEKYEEKDPRIYVPDYYQDRNYFPCDEEYLSKCLELLNEDKVDKTGRFQSS